jgi:hypothetical protein
MKGVQLNSDGAAIFEARFRCPHCKADQTLRIQNQVASIVLLNNQQQESQDTGIRVL